MTATVETTRRMALTVRVGSASYSVRRIGDLGREELEELAAISRRLEGRRLRPKRIRDAGLAMLRLLAPELPADRLDDEGLAEILNLVQLVARDELERSAAAA